MSQGRLFHTTDGVDNGPSCIIGRTRGSLQDWTRIKGDSCQNDDDVAALVRSLFVWESFLHAQMQAVATAITRRRTAGCGFDDLPERAGVDRAGRRDV
jgi:hypothetical protein